MSDPTERSVVLEAQFRQLFEASGFHLGRTIWTRVTDVPRRDDFPAGPWFRVETDIGPLLIGYCDDARIRLDWEEIGRFVGNEVLQNSAGLLERHQRWVYASGIPRFRPFLKEFRMALLTFSSLEIAAFLTGIDFVSNLERLERNITYRMLGHEPKPFGTPLYAEQVRACRSDLRCRQLLHAGLPSLRAVHELWSSLQSGDVERNPEAAPGLKHAFMMDACGDIDERIKIELLPDEVRIYLNM